MDVSFILAVIATILIILILVITTRMSEKYHYIKACRDYFERSDSEGSILSVMEAACYNSGQEEVRVIDLKNCVEFVNFNLGKLQYKIKNEKDMYEIKTKCDNGVIVNFIFIGNNLDSKKLKKYYVIISGNNVREAICQGEPENCSTFTEKMECESQNGCSWSDSKSKCIGIPQPCYIFSDETSCKYQLGCFFIG